ncbi:hypothetical protein ILYODFUR_035731 [Ilyodon furcidens]|uniref:Uncharacterized protein n=1 Tax=Ilyodon furcidens TaxID=33524 RepID=A0ABV0UNC0_9TELE
MSSSSRVLYLYNLWDQLISYTTLLSYFFRSCPLLLHTMAAFSWHYVNDIRNGAKQDRNVICEDVSFHLTFSCCLYRHFASEFQMSALLLLFIRGGIYHMKAAGLCVSD